MCLLNIHFVTYLVLFDHSISSGFWKGWTFSTKNEFVSDVDMFNNLPIIELFMLFTENVNIREKLINPLIDFSLATFKKVIFYT